MRVGAAKVSYPNNCVWRTPTNNAIYPMPFPLRGLCINWRVHHELSYSLSQNELLHVVDAIFEALCAGAEANPDAMDEDEGDFFFDQAQVTAGMDNDAQEHLAALEDRLQLPTVAEFEGMVAPQGGASAEQEELGEVEADGSDAEAHPASADTM
jgi:hypothetical protein